MIGHQRIVWTWGGMLLLLSCGRTEPPVEDKAVRGKAPAAEIRTDKTTGPESTAGAGPVRSADRYFTSVDGERLTGPLTLAETPKNSVLLIVGDALNARHLSAYGYSRPTSPVVDSLARQGVLFTNFVSNSSWTRPSFTTIITGYPKARHGVELRGGWRLKAEITTLAERFRKAGYRTAGYTGNPLVRKAWGFDQGFQVYEGPTTLGLKAFPRDEVLVDLAIDWLKKQQERPFFMTLFLTSSHPPYRPPEKPRRFLSSVPAGEIIEHPFKEYPQPLAKEVHDRIVAAYDDEVAYMDGQIGRLLTALEEDGRLDTTTVVVTADHGEMFGQHNCYLHAYHMWEPTLRVPLIIRSPRIAAEGAVDDTPFTHKDIAPTLLDIAGIPYNRGDLKGLSIVKEAGQGRKLAKRIRLSQYNAHGVRRQAVRQGRLKLVHHHKVAPEAAERLDELHPGVEQADPRDLPSLAWDGERYELYDLRADAEERYNLYREKRASPEVKALEAALNAHLKGRADRGRISPKLLKALEAVGYISNDNDKIQ